MAAVHAASEAIKTYVQCRYSLTILPSPSDIGAEVHRATPTYSQPLLVVDVQPGAQVPAVIGAHARALLCVLDKLLRLPLAQATLARAAVDAEGLLDGFLVLADAFGTLLAALVALRQHVRSS